MAGDSENKLDYGPAPGMGQERLPGGDIREWAEANNPDWVDSPNNLRKNPIYNPNNQPMRINPQDAYNPIAEGPGLITDEILPVALTQGAEGMADIPSQTNVGTVYDFHQKLVLVQGVPFGEATNIVERLYEQGDPEVHRLSGIDEWINDLPSKASRMGKAFSLGMQEFPAAMNKMLSESGMPDMIPPELRGHTITPDEIALQTEVLAKGKGVKGANLAGDIVPSIAAGIGAARLATKGLLQLPRYAAAKKMLEGSAVRARFGQALVTENLIAGSKNLRNAVIAGDVLGGTAAALGEVYVRDGSKKDLAITGAASVLGPLAFGLAGKVIFKKLSNLRDKPYVEGLSDTIDWLSRKSGVSRTELHSRINSFDNLAEQLVITGAPDVVLQKFYHGIPDRIWETELGTHFGMWHALEAGTAPDALDKILRNIPMIGRGAAKRAYYKAHEAVQLNALAEKDAAKALVKQGKRAFVPWKAPIVKVQVALGEGLENGGATTYFPPGSKFAKTASKLGPVPTKQKVLVRPAVVDFDPNTETLAEATLRTLKGRSDLVRVSNYILNKYPFHGPKEYADISNEFAYRTAKKLGYESIQGQATTGMKDNLYVDLLRYKPEASVAKIVDEIEAKIKKSYMDKFEGIPSIVLPAIGAGAVMFGMTPESEAISFDKFKKIFLTEAKKASNLKGPILSTKLNSAYLNAARTLNYSKSLRLSRWNAGVSPSSMHPDVKDAGVGIVPDSLLHLQRILTLVDEGRLDIEDPTFVISKYTSKIEDGFTLNIAHREIVSQDKARGLINVGNKPSLLTGMFKVEKIRTTVPTYRLTGAMAPGVDIPVPKIEALLKKIDPNARLLGPGVNFQFKPNQLFHVSPANYRGSILRDGLRLGKYGEETVNKIYLSQQTSEVLEDIGGQMDYATAPLVYDIWQVIAPVTAKVDPAFEPGYYTHKPIPPGDLVRTSTVRWDSKKQGWATAGFLSEKAITQFKGYGRLNMGGFAKGLVGATAIGAGVAGTPEESEAIDFSKLRKIIAKFPQNRYTRPVITPEELIDKLEEISYSRYSGGNSDFMPNISGITGGIGYTSQLNPNLQSAEEVLAKMEEVTGIIRTFPNKLDIEPINSNFLVDETFGTSSTLKRFQARFTHPDVVNDTHRSNAIHEVGSIYSTVDPSGELTNTNLLGFGPEVYGIAGLRQLMKLGKKLNLNIKGWVDENRISGVRSTQGGWNKSKSRGKFKAIPIVIGLAGVGAASQGQAAVLPPKKLQPIVDQITEKIYRSNGASEIDPTELFLDEVEAQDPATGRMLWGMYEKQAETGYTSKDKLLTDYAQVYKDLREDSPNIIAAATDTMPGRVNYELSHPLSARSISSIGGYVDPADGKWFLDVVGAKRAGIGQKVLQKVVDNAKTGGLIKGVKGKYSKLAMIAAATAASVAYDWIAPQESLAMPWGKLMGKGIKGAADEVAASMAGANSPEELLAAMRAARRAVVDSTNNEAFATKADALFAAGDINPDKALGDEFKKVLGSERLSSIASAGRPVAAIDDTFYDMFFTQMVSKRDAMLTSSNSVSHLSVKQADEILTKVDLKITEYDEFDAAIHGLRQNADGALVQSVKGISPRIDGAARQIREILDHLWQLKTGIHAKAPAIIKQFGLEESEDTWRMLQYIQGQDLANPTGPLVWKGRNIDPSEVAAAVQTKGLINPQPWQNMDTKFVDGYFTQMPIKGERVKLLDEHRRMLEMYPNGKMPADVKTSYKSIQDRLVVLADLEAGLARRRKISLLSTPKQHYYGPINEAEELDLPGISKEKDPKRILGSYIHGLHSSIYFDEQLYLSRGLTTYLAGEGDYPAAEFVRTMLNTYRGIRSVNEDSKVAYVFNSLRRKGQKWHLLGIDDPFTVQRVRNIASKVMEWQYMTKLAMQLRFPITNATQTALTTAPAVGWSNVMAATAKVMGNPKAAYAEAAAQHILRADSMFVEELEHTYKGKLITALDWLPSMSENFNRVVAYHAGKEQALKAIAKSGKFKPPSYIRYIDQDVLQNGTDKEIAEMYGKAVMYTTQFPTGPQGRPLMWSGGAIRRVAGQFKSFQVGYLGLLKDMLKHSKTGDAMPILSATTSLFILGGVQAVSLGIPAAMLIDWLRSSAAKVGLDPDIIPEGTPIGAALEMLGANPGIDISGSIQPGFPIFGVNPISQTQQAVNFALGPTFGGAMSVLGTMGEVAMGDKTNTDLATDVARQVLPLAVTGAEALQEAGIGTEFFDALNYRGGIYSESGESFVEDRPMGTIIKRGLNLQPSARSKQYDYVRQIERAMAADEPERVMDLVDQARMEGLVISDKIISGLKGKAKRKENKLKPNQPR